MGFRLTNRQKLAALVWGGPPGRGGERHDAESVTPLIRDACVHYCSDLRSRLDSGQYDLNPASKRHLSIILGLRRQEAVEKKLSTAVPASAILQLAFQVPQRVLLFQAALDGRGGFAIFRGPFRRSLSGET